MPDSPLDGVRSPLGPKPGGGPPPAFSPSSLYSSGSQGIWLDPSDLTTMFSDRAGTTPVTTPGTTVGLRLDKSKGLVLGSELVVNGGFATDTGWTKGTSTVISGGSATSTAQTGLMLEQAGYSFVVGKTYEIRLDVSAYSAGGINIRVGNNSLNNLTGIAANGSYVFRFAVLNIATQTFSLFSSGTSTLTIDNISVRELAGNHATAPTDAARPIYGVEPKGGRRNLLNRTEEFADSYWTKASSTATLSGVASPTGSLTAYKLESTSVSTGCAIYRAGALAAGHTTSIYMKSNSAGVYGWIEGIVAANACYAVFNLEAVSVVSSAFCNALIEDAGNGWRRCSIQNTSSTSSFTAFGGADTYTSGNPWDNAKLTAGKSVLIWGAQREVGVARTAYQRVTNDYDITESGVATCHYVQYDGSDDSLSTSAIDFTATDKMSVFAGVRKLSDVEMTIVELSNTWWNNTGTFAVGTLPTPYFSYSPALRGTASTYYTAGVDSTPNSRVLSALFDIAGTTSSQEVSFRADGTLKTLTSVSGTNAGTGNFGNYPLFLGRRGGATLPLNGRDFGIIIVGKAASAGEITDTETWLAARTAQVTL